MAALLMLVMGTASGSASEMAGELGQQGETGGVYTCRFSE